MLWEIPNGALWRCPSLSKHFSYALARRECKEFTRQAALRNDDKTLKPVYEKALLYFDAKELPSNWDKDDLFGADSEDEDDEEEVAL